jgi:hypothetical protein
LPGWTNPPIIPEFGARWEGVAAWQASPGKPHPTLPEARMGDVAGLVSFLKVPEGNEFCVV